MTPEQARIKAIISSEDGRALPTVAATLAFESELSAELAISFLASARKDVAAAAPPAAIDQPGGPATTHSVVGMDHHDGLGGLGAPQATAGDMNAEKVKASWAAAVATANASIGA